MVTGDATPLLQTTASMGQVIDRRRIEDLPLADGNPFILTRVAPGVVFTDVNNLRFTRPFDNGGTSSISANGAGSQTNEFTLDGIPDNAAFGRQVAYVPPAEAVHEFKVVTSSFDTQHGHSAGAHVDIVSRSGSNRATGAIYWFNRNEAFAANEFFVKANPNCFRDAEGDCKKNPLRYNRYGATFGGPVVVPARGGLASGKDRLFFFARLRRAASDDTWNECVYRADRGDAQRGLLRVVAQHRHPRSGHRVGQSRRPRRAHAFRREHHPARADERDREELLVVLAAAESGLRGCAMPQQSDYLRSAYRSVLFRLRPRGRANQQRATILRPLQPQSPQAAHRRLVGRDPGGGSDDLGLLPHQ